MRRKQEGALQHSLAGGQANGFMISLLVEKLTHLSQLLVQSRLAARFAVKETKLLKKTKPMIMDFKKLLK